MAVHRLLKPASDEQMIAWLHSLELATGKAQKLSSDDEDEKLDRYLAKLRKFPADIVEHVLATWDDRPPPTGEFFPRTAQLKQACDQAFAWRRSLLPALQRATMLDADAAPQRSKPTDEEAAIIAAKHAEVMRSFASTPSTLTTPIDGPSWFEQLLEQRARIEALEVESELHPEAFK